ncbi:MAG: hypothetical protein WCA35_27580, partial [Kovacikia sp.]
YRRLRGSKGHSVRSGNRKSAAKAPDLIPVPAATGASHLREIPPLAPPSTAESRADQWLTPPADHSGNAFNQAVATGSSHSLTSAFAADQANSDLAIAVPSPDNPLAADSTAQNAPLSPATGDAQSSLSTLNHQLDDYLESSEELLRSLAEEEAEVKAERGFMQSLLTPLGVGSMLLLLTSSAMFGYVVMNPASLVRLFRSSDSNVAKNPSDPTATNPAGTGLIAPQPNLANQEFKDLNLATLGTLKDDGSTPRRTSNSNPNAGLPGKPTTTSTRLGASGSSAPAMPLPHAPGNASSAPANAPAPPRRIESAPAMPAQPAPPVRVVDPPQPARLSSPSSSRSPSSSTYASPPRKPSPSASASPAATNAGSTSAASGGYGYKVRTQYDNDRTLEAVKKVVPDAYVRNFPDGARIQVGASSNAADAEAKAQALRNQGIPAEVYKP